MAFSTHLILGGNYFLEHFLQVVVAAAAGGFFTAVSDNLLEEQLVFS